MFSESSGSMYEELENARKKKIRKRKVLIRRIVAIVILILILVYLGLFLNDLRRYKNGDTPLINIGYSSKEYDDGKVETYYSIGWIFRYYYRETISTSEVAPFWSEIKMDNVLNRVVSDPDLPEVETDYTVPKNPNNRDKVDDVLFFYDSDKNLLGTYKCILSERDCLISISATFEEDDDEDRAYNLPMAIIDNRYVFITEYKNKQSEAEEMHVYLYDIEAKHIIAQYQDVRYSTIYVDEDSQSSGLIDGNRYMVKKNDLWGIDEVNKGKVSNFEDYKYKFEKYDDDNQLYVFKNTNDEWIAMDANKKMYSAPVKESIESIFYKDGKIYVIAYVKATGSKRNYLLYNQDGVNVLSKENIDDLKAYDEFLIYTNDNYLYVINYDGQEVVSAVKLYVESRYKDSYSVKVIGNTLVISTPHDRKSTHLTDEYHYNISDWSLIRTRLNVSETT